MGEYDLYKLLVLAAVEPFANIMPNDITGQKGKEQNNIFLHGAHLISFKIIPALYHNRNEND